MALLCQHNHVLFLSNITIAGKKQYYTFALFRELLNQLPHNITAGVLYNIEYTIYYSCIKYDFLSDILPCITFSISMFHMYRYQWPC